MKMLRYLVMAYVWMSGQCMLSAASAVVPYGKSIEMLPLSAALKSELTDAWTNLYLTCQQASQQNESLNNTTQKIENIDALLNVNYFKLMSQYLDSQNVSKFVPKLSQTDVNYATFHMRAALDRLASITNFTNAQGAPKIDFAGDVRDLGIIVNLYNNTQAEFGVYQTNVSTKKQVQIGAIKSGVNGLNLHLAGLQQVAKSSNNITEQQAKTLYSFDFIQQGSQNPIKISIRLMQGRDLINFLKTLPRSTQAIAKDTFEMNGLPTSADYLSDIDAWYLVLIQNPTPLSQTVRDINQRIQAVNISNFTDPFLCTIQFSEQTIDVASGHGHTTSQKIYQSCISTIKSATNQSMKSDTFPLILLPNFLWKVPVLETYWMMLTTVMLAIKTEYALFGKTTFGDAYEYFNNLGCFGNQNNWTLFLDLYNRFTADYVVYNASWLRAAAVYETSLAHCSDIPQLYTAQDPYGHVIVNEAKFYYINFIVECVPKIEQVYDRSTFEKKGFNAMYAYPLNQLYSIVVNALATDIKEGIFGAVTQIKQGVYQLDWTNKKNELINSQVLYLGATPSNIQIAFANIHTNWVGSALPTDLLPLEIGKTMHFKVTYEYSPANDKHILLAQSTSPIDKQEVFLPLQFSQYPIQELYVDVFNVFNVKPFTRCYIVKDGVLPECLTTLTQQDWQSGIYMVPVIKNNSKLSQINVGSLTAMFYGPNKKYLGEVEVPVLFNNTIETGIREPVTAYAVYFSEYNMLRWLYLSTGVILKYIQV